MAAVINTHRTTGFRIPQVSVHPASDEVEQMENGQSRYSM